MGVQSFLTQSKGGDQRKFNANEVGSLDYYRVGGGEFYCGATQILQTSPPG